MIEASRRFGRLSTADWMVAGTALFIICNAVSVCIGWWVRIPILVQLAPHAPTYFNTALMPRAALSKHHDKPHGEVVLSATHVGDFVEFIVRDDGTGTEFRFQWPTSSTTTYLKEPTHARTENHPAAAR